MRFAQRRAGPGTSNVSASGQSDVLRVATTSSSVNALIQVCFAVIIMISCQFGLASWVKALATIQCSLQGVCCAGS